MRELLCFDRRLQHAGRNPVWIAGATRLIWQVSAAPARSSCAQVLANAYWHSTAFHGRASMRGRLRRREAVLRETPPPFHGRASMRGRLRRREAVLRETPPPFHGRASMRGRLRRREAVLRETPPPFHGRASMRGRLRRREAVLRETPPPPLSRNLPGASARATPASPVKYPG